MSKIKIPETFYRIIESELKYPISFGLRSLESLEEDKQELTKRLEQINAQIEEVKNAKAEREALIELFNNYEAE